MHFEFDALDLIGRDALGAQLRAGVNAGVDHDAAGKGFVGVEGDLKALAQLVGDLRPVVLERDGLHHAAWRFNRLGAGGKALAGQQGRHHARTRRATGVKGLGHAAKLLAHANGLRGGNAQRHGGLLHVELQQAGAGGCRTQRAGGAGDVPAAVVVVGVHGVAHAAGHVNADDQRVDQGAAGEVARHSARRSHVLGQRQDGRGHGASRVDDGFEVGVVKVKGVGGDAVDQRGAGHVHLLSAAQHAGLCCGLQQLHRGQSGVGRLVLCRTDGAAKPVDEGAVRFVVHRVAPALGGVSGDKLGEDLRDRGGVVVSGDLGIAGHGEGLSESEMSWW